MKLQQQNRSVYYYFIYKFKIWKQEVAVRNLSVVPTCLKTKEKSENYSFFFSIIRQIIIIFIKNDTFCCNF